MTIETGSNIELTKYFLLFGGVFKGGQKGTLSLTRIIQSLYYAPAGRYINAWMHSLIKSVKPEIVNRYDLWVLTTNQISDISAYAH
jgi:hypothetical protein